MRYLKGTKDMCICFGHNDAFVVGYTDADFAGNVENMKSTIRYVFTFIGGVVSWISPL